MITKHQTPKLICKLNHKIALHKQRKIHIKIWPWQEKWDLAKYNLTTEEIKNKLLLATNSGGNTAWQFAAQACVTEHTLRKICDLAKDNLTTEEI
jgi:hypothetical protein